MTEYQILNLMYIAFISNSMYFVAMVLLTWLGFRMANNVRSLENPPMIGKIMTSIYCLFVGFFFFNTSQIGGGQGELNVNSITAGVVQISGSTITTTTNVAINTLQKVNFAKGVDGHPLAMNYYLQQ